jgi:hypothetical protein
MEEFAHVPATFSREKRPGAHLIAGWVGSRGDLKTVVKKEILFLLEFVTALLSCTLILSIILEFVDLSNSELINK